jgi:hypothetical protein
LYVFRKYGDSWGEGKKAEGAKCASGFPLWMLVMGLLGFFNTIVFFNLQTASYSNWLEIQVLP